MAKIKITTSKKYHNKIITYFTENIINPHCDLFRSLYHMEGMTIQINSVKKTLGQYKILKQYSSGSTSTVYKIQNTKGDFFCLKVYLDEDVEIFPGESYLKSSHLVNTNIPYMAKVYEVNKYVEDGNDVHYSILEFVNGLHLFEYINTKEYDSQFVKDLAYRLYQANNHLLQNNLGHRDITTSNILVKNDGSSVLIDFGMISRTDTDNFTYEESAFFYPELYDIIGLPNNINYNEIPTYWRIITLFQIKRVINDVIIRKSRMTFSDLKVYLKLEYEIRLLAAFNNKPVALLNTGKELLKFFRRISNKMVYFKK